MKCYRCQGWPCQCDDGQTVIHGDSEEVLAELEQEGMEFDLLITDPPYGIKAGKNGTIGGSVKAKVKDYGAVTWDDEIRQDLIDQARSLSRHSIIFGGNYYHLPPASCWLVWDKDNGENYFADCELAWTDLQKAVRRIKYRWAGMLQEHGGRHKEERFHPTQKPKHVMRWTFEQAGGEDKIKTSLDPFMGSGTTLVAARDMGISCLGIEAQERFCEVAAERLDQRVLF